MAKVSALPSIADLDSSEEFPSVGVLIALNVSTVSVVCTLNHSTTYIVQSVLHPAPLRRC
jgi:hypothetical protein